MNDLTATQHDELRELLPDYATGALDDHDLERVEEHLATCEECQQDLQALLEVGGTVPEPVIPSGSVKGALLAQIAIDSPSRPELTPLPAPMTRQRSPRRDVIRWSLNVAAILALLIGGYWTYTLWQDDEENRQVQALLESPQLAHVLTDSQVATNAFATMYVDPGETEALLVTSGLEPLPEGESYVVWLFTQEGERSNAGTVQPDSEGHLTALIDAPETFASYWAVGISVEQDASTDAPTTPLIIGGWIR